MARRRLLRVRGRSLEITRAGWVFIGLTLLVGFAAINSGSNLLHAIFGAQMAVIVGSGVVSEGTLRRVAVHRRVLGPIHAGSPAVLAIDVSCDDGRDALAVSVEDDPREHVGRCEPVFAVRVPGRGSVRLSTAVTMPRRGPCRLPRAVAATRFPFGLFVKRRELGPGAEILVYPALSPPRVPPLPDDPGGDVDGTGLRVRAGEFFGLREYRDGDDPRALHWPAVARLGRPVVREHETGRRPEHLVDVPIGAAGDEAFEAAISIAAGTAVALLDAGERVGLQSRGAVTVPPATGNAQRHRVLQALARAGFADPAREDAA